MRFFSRLSLTCLAAGSFCLTGLRGESVAVFAAASLSEALAATATDYESATGDKIVLNLGASSTLARQIKAGAQADVFFSADAAKMDELALAGCIVAETRRDLLSNTLVIVVNAHDGAAVITPTDLAGATVRRLALAETTTVPAGIYAREFLIRAGLWESIVPKVVATENVRAALAAVAAGDADAGIVYKTDALISKDVRIVHVVPAAEGPRIVYPVAVVKESPVTQAARRFVEYLDSPQARAVFMRFGFLPAE